MVLSCATLAATPYQRPWGQSGSEGAEVYHREPGPRRYNPWEKFRDEAKGQRDTEQSGQSMPRYREKKKLTLPERNLPQFFDGRGVPSDNYPLSAPGYAPYGWGGVGGPMPWGYPAPPMYLAPGAYPWRYRGW